MPLRRPSDALSDVAARYSRREHIEHQRQTRRVKIGIPISGDPGPYRQRSNPPAGIAVIPAIVTTAITACSGTTPGQGAAQLYYLDTPDATGATADVDNSAVTVFNWYTASGTVAVNAHILVAAWSYQYWLIGADC